MNWPSSKPVTSLWDFLGYLAIALIGISAFVAVCLGAIYTVTFVIARAIRVAWGG